MDRNFSLGDKIKAAERLIEDLRWSRNDPMVPEFTTYWVMKAVASDLRARQRHVKLQALDDLQHAIDMAHASKIRPGYEMGKLQHLAELLIGKWPVVRQALESFASHAEIEE